MTETMFVRLHEENDWEGERWNWWLQVAGNEVEISKLLGLLRKAEIEEEFDLPFKLHPQDVEPESVVDKLVEYAVSGYNDSDIKVTGKFTCPEDLGYDCDQLYKGGVNNFFEDE